MKELSGRNITHIFDTAGKYEVELNATKDSKSVTTYQEVTVTEKAAATAATTAATTAAVAKTALSADDDLIPNPMDVIDEFIRLLLAMMNPAKYNVEI